MGTTVELTDVRQMSSEQNKSQNNLILQLMTGYKDPKENNDNVNYATTDYQTIAFSIYSRIPPWDVTKDKKNENGHVIGTQVTSIDFFTQLQDAYDEIKTPEDKTVFLHNTKILISNLITANTNSEYLEATRKGVNDFYTHAKTAENNPEYNFEPVKSDLTEQISSMTGVNKKIAAEHKAPIRDGSQSFAETLGSESNKQTAKNIAQDLKEVQLRLLRQLDLSDMHNQKWSKDKNKELSYSNITTIFNDTSNMVINDIVSAKTEEEQQRIYFLYLNVATEAVKLNDFQTAVAIKAGLDSAPVGRLKHLSKSKKNRSKIDKLSRLYSTDGNNKKLRAAYNEARDSGETFVPYLGTFNGDLTFIGDGNPSKVRDKDNGVKFLQEGVVIGFIADAKSKALQSKVKPCIYDICTRISEPSELSDKEQYNKSLIFRPRNPVNLSEIKSLNNLASCFKEGSVHTMLSVTLEKDGKEYSGKKAFQHVVDTILPLYTNPSLSDKLEGSSANTILDSIEQWAINHNQNSQELAEEIQRARKAISQTPNDKQQLDQLQAYQYNMVDIYIKANIDDRKAIRADIDEFKNSTNSYITGEINKTLIALNSIDGVDKLYKNYQGLNSVVSNEPIPTNIHVSLTTLLELDALAIQASEQKSSTIDHVKGIATNIHKDIIDDNGVFVDYNKKLLANIAKDIDKLPDICKALLVDSLQNSNNKKTNETNLKNIIDALSILMKDPALKDQASAVKQTIDNKLLKLDTCQAEKFDKLLPHSQLKSARDIVQLLNDDDLMVKQWAEALSKNPDIAQNIEEAKNADSSLVESLQNKIMSKMISHVDKLSTKDKNYKPQEVEKDIDSVYQETLTTLKAIENGPFKEANTAAINAIAAIEMQHTSYARTLERHYSGASKPSPSKVAKPKKTIQSKANSKVELGSQVKQFQVSDLKPQTSLILQLMSGHRDPEESNKNNYSLEDYKTIAFSIYSRIPPWDVIKGTDVKSENFFTQLNKAYDAVQNPTDKAIFMHNAKILITELISANTNPEYLNATNQGIQDFYQYAKTSDDSVYYSFESAKADLMAKVDITKNTNKKILVEINSPPVPGDKKIADLLASKEKKHDAKEMAQEFKSIQLQLLRQFDLSDLHNQKWSKNDDLSYNNIANVFNNASNQVINDILSAKTVKEQQRIYDLYIDIAVESIEMNDFQSALAISAALQSSPISRLEYLNKSKESQTKLTNINKLFSTEKSYKNLRAAYNEAKSGNDSFVPFVGVFNTDLTFIGDGNPDKVGGKDNGIKFLQEGDVIQFIAEAKLRAIHSDLVPYDYDLCTRVLNSSELTTEEQYNQSLAFSPRKAVDLDTISSLEHVVEKFDQGVIATKLTVIVDDKEYTGKKAFQHIVNTLLPLYTNPSLSDKLEGSSANTILNSIEQWAINHNQNSPELAEEIQRARKAISQTPNDKQQLDQLQAYQYNMVDIYIKADIDDRKIIRADIDEFKNSTNSYITGEIDKILMALNSIDGVDNLYKNYQGLNSVVSSEPIPTNIHVSLTTLLELDALATQASEQKSSTIDHVKGIATNIHKDITDDNGVFVDYNKKLLANIAKNIDNLPDIYKALLVDSLQNSDNKTTNDTNLKNIVKALSILIKDPAHKEQARTANKIIANLLKLDKCQADKFEDLPSTNKLKSAVEILSLLDDDNPMVQQWAKDLFDNSKIKQQVELAKQNDLKSVQSIEDGIIPELLTHLAKISTKEKKYDIEAAERKIKIAYQESLAKLEIIEKGPIEEARTSASSAREIIESQYQSYTAQIEKHKSGKDEATKVQISKSKGQKKPSKNAAKEAKIAHLSDAEREICQKFDLSSEDIGILKIYGMDSISEIEEWQQTFEAVESQKDFASAFNHIGERITRNYPGSEKTAARMALAVLIAADLNRENISELDFSKIELESVQKMLDGNTAFRKCAQDAIRIIDKESDLKNYRGSFKTVMFKVSGKSNVFSKKELSKIQEKFQTEDKFEHKEDRVAITEQAKSWFSGMAPIQSEIKTAQTMLRHCSDCLSQYPDDPFDDDDRLTEDFIAYIKADEDIPVSYTDTNSYDSMLFRHMMSHLQAQDNAIRQEIDSQNDDDEMEVLFEVDQPSLTTDLEAEILADELIAQLKSPSIPEQVQQLADKGFSNKDKTVNRNQLTWIEDTFNKTEKEIRVSLKNIPPPKTYSLSTINEAIQVQPENTSSELPHFTIVEGVSVNDLHKMPLGQNSVLQVASQFDFQESVGAFDAPVTSYASDRTQGPQASIEAAAAALHRKAAKDAGNLPNALTDLIPEDLQIKYPELYRHGYLQLSVIKDEQDKIWLLQHIKNNIEKLKVLPQDVICESTQARQLQVFCAAPSFQGAARPAEGSTDDLICKKLVVAQYTATAQLAVIKARETGKIVPLHLTFVGQGAFNNHPTVMQEAMESVASVVKGENVAVFAHAYNQAAKNKIEAQLESGKGSLFTTGYKTAEVFSKLATLKKLDSQTNLANKESLNIIIQEDDIEQLEVQEVKTWFPTISIDDEIRNSNNIILSNLNNEIERVQSTGGDNKTQLNALYSLRSICETRANFGTIDFESIVAAAKISMLPEQRLQFDTILDTCKISDLFESEKQVTVQQPTDGEGQEDSVDTNIEVVIKPDTEDESDQAKLLRLQELAFQFASDPKNNITKDELDSLRENLTALEKESPQWAKLEKERFTLVVKPKVKPSTIIEEQQTSPADSVDKNRRASTFLNQNLQAARKPKIDPEAPKQATQTAKQPPVSNQQVMQELKQAQKTGTSTADNLSIQAITDAAIAQKRSEGVNSKIVDIKTFPNDSTKKHGVMVSFKTDKPGTVVKTYAEDMGNDKVQFSIQKNASEEHKNTGIQAMCRLAVSAADKNTIFNVPASNKNPERQKFIEQCFKDAIQDAVAQNKFPEGTPTINLSTSPPPPAPRKGPGTRGGAAPAA